jgi:outer membrane protein assembly factor BamA
MIRRRQLAGVSLSLFAAANYADQGALPDCDKLALVAHGSYAFVDQIDRTPNLQDNLTIGDIKISNLPVFDLENPDENNALYRFANRWHINTKTSRISQKLLFKEGDEFSQATMDESARLLRDEKFLYDADIRPTRLCQDEVDLEVITRDVWSFTPELSFKRSGGDNEFRLGVRDTNVLGTGTQLAMLYKRDIDRKSTEFRYRDKNFRGSRKEARLTVADNDDGWRQTARLELPFYALDSRNAWLLGLERFKRIDTQYELGEEVSEVEQKAQEYSASYGWSNGLKDGVANRWSLGYSFKQLEFSPGEEFLPPLYFPIDKKLSYPFFVYERVEDKFTTSSNYDQIHRTEDLYLGQNFRFKLGLASKALGSDQDRMVIQGGLSGTLAYNGDHWLTHQFDWEGLLNLETDKSEDVLVEYSLRYFIPQTSHRSFFASLLATYSHNLNANQKVSLGGESGARAFDNRYQNGSRRWILNLEERMYTDIHLFNLIRVGWAIFIDVGRAWDPDQSDGLQDKYLADYGFGLRLSSSKADAGSVMHVDLSFPMTNKNEPGVASSQVSVTLKDHF